MGKVVEITVEYRRTVQPAEYQSRSAAAIIKWAADEDEVADLQEELEASFDVAVANVHTWLEIDDAPAKTTKKAPAKKPAAKKPAAKSAASLDDDEDETDRQITDNPEDRKPAAKKKSTARSGKAAAAKAKSAASLEDEEPELPEHLDKAKKAAKDLEGDDGEDEITNDDLNKAAKKRREEMVADGVEDAGKLIMQCIADFGPGDGKPFQLKDIPQKSRAKFLSKLELVGKSGVEETGDPSDEEDWMKD